MKTRSALLAIALFGVILFVTAVSSQESPTQPSPADTIGFSAEQRITMIDWLGRVNRSSAKIYKAGPIVRYEHPDESPSEASIINYDQKKEYRIYHDDHIFFEVDISDRTHVRAQREGLIPLVQDPSIEVKYLSLGPANIEGHPSEIILQVRKRKGEKGPRAEYTLRWEALDLNRLPLRIAYQQTVQTLIVVEYRNLKQGPIDPALLQTPAGYLSFTPY